MVCADQYIKSVQDQLPKVKSDPEMWDLAQLISIFLQPKIQEAVFKKCFDEKSFKTVIAHLM